MRINLISPFNNKIKSVNITDETLEEIIELEKDITNGKKVEIIFDEDGNFMGHIWNHNCFYTKEDDKKNNSWRPATIDDFSKLWEKINQSIYRR